MTDALLETSCPHFVRAFGALLKAMSTDETRLHYYGVNVVVDSMRVMLETTNGHTLARWMIRDHAVMVDVTADKGEARWVVGKEAHVFIPSPAVRKAFDAAKRWVGSILEIEENAIRMAGGGPVIEWETPMYPEHTVNKVVYPARRVEFPWSASVWPNPHRKPEQDFSLSPEYLRDVGDSFKAGYDRPKKKNKHESSAPVWPPLLVNVGGDLEPIVFRSPAVPPLTYLVMPCRK